MYCKFELFEYMNTKQIHVECIASDGYLLCMITAYYYDIAEDYRFNLHIMDINCEQCFRYLLENKLAEIVRSDKNVKIISQNATIYHMRLTPLALLQVL
jgi:hypothetical protein